MIYNMCSAPALIFILIAAQPREYEGKKNNTIQSVAVASFRRFI